MFDMLVEGKVLSKAERGLVNRWRGELLDALKAEKLRIELWAEKEATRAEVSTFIREWLWSDQRGLPPSYTIPEVEARAERGDPFVFALYGKHQIAVNF